MTRAAWVLVLAACSGGAPPAQPLRSVEVRLGDCAPVGSSWVSGPRPQPFDPGHLDAHPTIDPHGGAQFEPEYMPVVGSEITYEATPAPVNQQVLDVSYRAGRESPLALVRTELGRCFALGTGAGVAVIELARAEPVAQGVEPKVAACIAALTVRSAPQACSVAFGTLGAGEVAGITIDGTDDFVVPKDVGLVAIRPAPQTPMKLVRRVLEETHAAGHAPVLAAKRGTAWQLVSPMALPVVPTPGQTGGQWSHAWYLPPASPLPWLELVVTANGITFTESGHQEELGKDQLGQLPARLAARRAQGDRIIRVTAHDDVTYNRVVELLDALTAAGFTEWSVK